MLFDALILAGGRSLRLGGVPKAELVYRRDTLVRRTVSAVGMVRRVVVVGPMDAATVLPESVPAALLTVRDSPPFGGPAAGIAAGAHALAEADATMSAYTIVVACDMPGVEAAVTALLQAVSSESAADGVIAVDENERLQPLVAIYRTSCLNAALVSWQQTTGVNGLPVFRLIADLDLARVVVPPGSTADVDTWPDAAKFGIARPPRREEEGR